MDHRLLDVTADQRRLLERAAAHELAAYRKADREYRPLRDGREARARLLAWTATMHLLGKGEPAIRRLRRAVATGRLEDAGTPRDARWTPRYEERVVTLLERVGMRESRPLRAPDPVAVVPYYAALKVRPRRFSSDPLGVYDETYYRARGLRWTGWGEPRAEARGVITDGASEYRPEATDAGRVMLSGLTTVRCAGIRSQRVYSKVRFVTGPPDRPDSPWLPIPGCG